MSMIVLAIPVYGDFGNVPTPVSPDGLVLNPAWQSDATLPGIYETTLPGSVVNPGNLKTFAASLQWSFAKTGNPTLRIGWEKPWQWSRFDQCPVFLQIDRDGRTSLNVAGKAVGRWQLPAAKDGQYVLTVAQEPSRVVLRAGSQEISFAMPAGFVCRPGYLALQLQGDAGALATVRRIEINAFGNEPPLTAAQRRNDIQRWARSQMRRRRRNARTTQGVFAGGDRGRTLGIQNGHRRRSRTGPSRRKSGGDAPCRRTDSLAVRSDPPMELSRQKSRQGWNR